MLTVSQADHEFRVRSAGPQDKLLQIVSCVSRLSNILLQYLIFSPPHSHVVCRIKKLVFSSLLPHSEPEAFTPMMSGRPLGQLPTLPGCQPSPDLLPF